MNKQGCAVHTEHAPEPSLVIDLDHPTAPVRSNARKCDYLFLAEDSTPKRLLVVPVELKSIGLNPAVVESQLQAGASVAERIVSGSSPIQFVPVAVHGSELRRRVYQELRKKRIRFRQHRRPIVTIALWRLVGVGAGADSNLSKPENGDEGLSAIGSRRRPQPGRRVASQPHQPALQPRRERPAPPRPALGRRPSVQPSASHCCGRAGCGWMGLLDPVVPLADSAEAYRQIDLDPGTSIKLGVTYE